MSLTTEMQSLIARCRSRAMSHRATGFLEAATDLLALAGLVESLAAELIVVRGQRDLHRREAALAASAAQEALPLALGALEATVAISDSPLGVASPEFTGHLIGLRTIAQTVRLAALRCDSIRPYLPPNTPVTDAEPSTPANTRAQGPRSV